MNKNEMIKTQRFWATINTLSLVITNISFYLAVYRDTGNHLYDFVGISTFLLVIASFYPLHWKSGFWQLIHTNTSDLDERELQLAHKSLARAYSIFTVLCLVIMLLHAVLFRFSDSFNLVLTVPLVSSLIYFAHTLPALILAWNHPAPTSTQEESDQ